jgi:hypothetical protein
MLDRLPEQLTELPMLLSARTEEEQAVMQDVLVQVLRENKDMFQDWTEETLLALLESNADA